LGEETALETEDDVKADTLKLFTNVRYNFIVIYYVYLARNLRFMTSVSKYHDFLQSIKIYKK